MRHFRSFLLQKPRDPPQMIKKLAELKRDTSRSSTSAQQPLEA